MPDGKLKARTQGKVASTQADSNAGRYGLLSCRSPSGARAYQAANAERLDIPLLQACRSEFIRGCEAHCATPLLVLVKTDAPRREGSTFNVRLEPFLRAAGISRSGESMTCFSGLLVIGGLDDEVFDAIDTLRHLMSKAGIAIGPDGFPDPVISWVATLFRKLVGKEYHMESEAYTGILQPFRASVNVIDMLIAEAQANQIGSVGVMAERKSDKHNGQPISREVVRERLERIYEAGEPYTSQRELAKSIGTEAPRVNEAIKDSEKLTKWMNAARDKKKNHEPNHSIESSRTRWPIRWRMTRRMW